MKNIKTMKKLNYISIYLNKDLEKSFIMVKSFDISDVEINYIYLEGNIKHHRSILEEISIFIRPEHKNVNRTVLNATLYTTDNTNNALKRVKAEIINKINTNNRYLRERIIFLNKLKPETL